MHARLFESDTMHLTSIRSLLLLSAALAPAPAFTQAQPTTEPETAQTAPTFGDTITVTARRREESAQQVPVAISVVGGDQLDAIGAFNVQRLQQLTPALNFYSSNPRNTAINIRGIGVPFGLTNDGFDQGVGIYVDDVYFARIASATLDFLDVDRIEVLRGPQGTLYGKNTTAGAVNITTRRPTFDFEGSAEVSFGNLGFKQGKASVSGPLSDSLAARFAVSSTSRRGTIYNVTSNNWINEQENLGLRGQLLWEPRADLEVLLAGDFSRQNPECCAQIYVRTGSTQRPLNRQYAALTAAQGYEVVSTNPFDRLTDVDASLNAGNEIGGGSVRAIWDTGPGTLTSITAYRYWNWLPENDRDFTGLPINTASNNPSQQKQYTQELRYAHVGDSYDFLIGAFAFRQEVRTQGLTRFGPAASRWLLNPTSALANDPSVLDGLTANNDIRLDNTSLAAFGQFNWQVTDRFSIQPGFRVNYDKKVGLYDSVVTNGAGQLVTFASTDPRIVAQRGVASPQRFEPRFSDWNFSYDLTATFELADDINSYATYAKTFKPGGVNLNGVPNDAAGNPILAAGAVLPESVTHYEAGVKSQFWDRRITLNVGAFRTDIDDYQALVVNGQFGVQRGYLANAEAVRTQGIEWDLSARPSERFSAYVAGSYTDATYRRFTDAPCPPELSGGGTGPVIGAPGAPGTNSPANCDISGQILPGVSKWVFSYGAEANAPVTFLEQDGEIYFGVDANTRSSFSSNPTPSIYTQVAGYSIANFRAGFRTDNGLNIFAWLRNAFDTEYFEQLAVPSGNTGLIVGQPGDERTYGLTIAYNF
ncbi:TonB-dependent receptor [Altererythrobacter sp. KTW20L]|uniref:TonB-dependent receptor n=1 Tax=Altererythrobacter sp. KTW20L TaxID=2942210 RepID=UPI0020BD4D53|nr:TonB-dependent receptor [Altererythrobacter sp. KTW20L]MCL6251522.1 TonB-dependent receptor [Altererythrobacter sp. KTW20L]